MSRYDFRVRRHVFRSGNLEKYKDFRSLEKEYASRKRLQKLLRFLLVLMALILLSIGLALTANASNQQKAQRHAAGKIYSDAEVIKKADPKASFFYK